MTTATATWPTVGDYERVQRLLVEAFDGIDELETNHLGEIEALQAKPDVWREVVPTLEELGALTRFIATAEADVENIGVYLKGFCTIRDQAALHANTGADDAS